SSSTWRAAATSRIATPPRSLPEASLERRPSPSGGLSRSTATQASPGGSRTSPHRSAVRSERSARSGYLTSPARDPDQGQHSHGSVPVRDARADRGERDRLPARDPPRGFVFQRSRPTGGHQVRGDPVRTDASGGALRGGGESDGARPAVTRGAVQHALAGDQS